MRNYIEGRMIQVRPVQAQPLSNSNLKTTSSSSFFGIASDTGRVGISECERVSCEVLWVHMRAGESILNDSTVIDIERDCGVCVLISEVHLAELCRGFLVNGTIPS